MPNTLLVPPCNSKVCHLVANHFGNNKSACRHDTTASTRKAVHHFQAVPSVFADSDGNLFHLHTVNICVSRVLKCSDKNAYSVNN